MDNPPPAHLIPIKLDMLEVNNALENLLIQHPERKGDAIENNFTSIETSDDDLSTEFEFEDDFSQCDVVTIDEEGGDDESDHEIEPDVSESKQRVVKGLSRINVKQEKTLRPFVVAAHCNSKRTVKPRSDSVVVPLEGPSIVWASSLPMPQKLPKNQVEKDPKITHTKNRVF